MRHLLGSAMTADSAAYLPPCPGCGGDPNWCGCCPCCLLESGDCACDEIACGWDHLGGLHRLREDIEVALRPYTGTTYADMDGRTTSEVVAEVVEAMQRYEAAVNGPSVTEAE